jgi:hypothetical protein
MRNSTPTAGLKLAFLFQTPFVNSEKNREKLCNDLHTNHMSCFRSSITLRITTKLNGASRGDKLCKFLTKTFLTQSGSRTDVWNPGLKEVSDSHLDLCKVAAPEKEAQIFDAEFQQCMDNNISERITVKCS